VKKLQEIATNFLAKYFV